MSRGALLAVWLAAALSLGTVFAAVPSIAQTPASKRWAHESSDIIPDPRVAYGELPNGLRYALLPNQLPPGAVSMRLAFEVGSLNEADSERGLAHFIEHLAFNGSRHVPEGEMVRKLERLGLSFGPDVNASTDRRHTVYRLDLPSASEDAVSEALFLLREVASELTFNAEAVERERGVVLAELRQSQTFVRRRSDQLVNFLIPGAYAATRSPGGDEATLLQASQADLTSLYDRYYRPERAVLIVAGDIKAADMRAHVEKYFSDWEGRGRAGEVAPRSYVPSQHDAAASIFAHDAGGDSVSVYSPVTFEDPPDSIEHRRESDLLAIGMGVMARRFARLAEDGDPPFRSAGLVYVSILNTVDTAIGSVDVKPGGWKRGLQALEQAWRRALLFGFTDAEIDEQLSMMRTDRRNAAARENSRTTATLISLLLGAILDDAVFATPSSALERFEKVALDATPEGVVAAFRKRLTIGVPLIFVSTSLETPIANADVVTAWEESQAVPVEAPGERPPGAFAYGSFGKAGSVKSDGRIEDIDTRIVSFANNVRLNVKRTPYQKDTVLVSVRVAGGEAALSEAPLGLSSLMGAFATGGLEAHSVDELRSVLAGHAVQANFGISPTAFGGTYVTTPADLELQLQVAAAFVMHPGYRPEGERRWRDAVTASWSTFKADTGPVLSSDGLRILASGDLRVGADPGDGVVNRTFSELKTFVEPLLRTAAIEIAIVGDVDEDQAIAAVAKTFGALPVRQRAWTPYHTRNPVHFRAARDPIVLSHRGEPNHAFVGLFWPIAIDPDEEPQAVRVLSAMVAVMQLKVTEHIREQQGASYSPSVGAMLSAIHMGWGYLVAGADIRPQDSDRIAATLREVASDLRLGIVSKDELERAVNPPLEQLPGHAVMNSYWLSLISELQFRPDRAERAKLAALETGFRRITVEDVVAAANQWLASEAEQELRIVPSTVAPPDETTLGGDPSQGK
jgi:zinc protease